jgi:cysteine desulfurase
VGALYKRKGIRLEPQLLGGGQEGNLRSGTYNVPGIVGFAKAVVMEKELQTKKIPQFARWKSKFLAELSQKLSNAVLVGSTSHEETVPYIINLSFPGIKSEVLVHALEEQEIYVSSKSACSSKTEKPSRVIQAMGYPTEVALSSIRISMAYNTEEDHLSRALEALCRIIPDLQQVMKVQKK